VFIHTNHRNTLTYGPINHNEVPQLHVCLTGRITSPNEVEEAKVETDYKKFKSEQ